MSTLDALQTMPELLALRERESADQIALIAGERQSTYAQFARNARRVANGLASITGAGARVAWLAKSSDYFFELFFGGGMVGMTAVPVNWRLAPKEIAYIIDNAEAEIVIVGPDYYDLIANIREDLPKVKAFIATEAGHESWPAFPTWRDGFPDSETDYQASPDDVVIQMYTSGTTGLPKGACLSHLNFLTALKNCFHLDTYWSPTDRCLLVIPQFHIAGVGYGLFPIYESATVIIMSEADPAQILRLVEAERITKVFVVPALLLFMLQHPNFSSTDCSSLDLISYGGSPINKSLLEQARLAFPGCGFQQAYGLTETCGVVALLMPDHHESGGEVLGSAGKPVTGVEVVVRDAVGKPLPIGEVGEITCRSGMVMQGYWRNPQQTDTAIRDGWFYTGDAGYMDEDGFIFINDRVKDMIISGGENIYPAEVESMLFECDGVADVAVIGVPHNTWGEAVMAFVVRGPGSDLSEESLIEFARERMAHFKAPRSVHFMDMLPRNPTGKILKRVLREPYWKGRTRGVN